MGMGRLEHNGTAIRVQSKYRTMARPMVVLFDVNDTLLPLWFTTMLQSSLSSLVR